MFPPLPAPVSRAGEALLDLVLPADCLVCDAPGTRLCPDCRGVLEEALAAPRRVEAGAAALPLGADGEPLPVTAAGLYAPPLSTALLALKDHHALHLRPLLGGALARAVAAARWDPGTPGAAHALLVPVPGSAAGFRKRGYDPLEELCADLDPTWVRRDLVRAPRLGRPGRASRGSSHAGADARQRRRRDRGWTPRPGRVRPGTPVLLLDDVLTTGATLGALADVVRRAGAEPVGAVVVAGVCPPRGSDSTEPERRPGDARAPTEGR